MSTIEMNLKGFSEFEQLKKTVDDQGEIIRQQTLQIHGLQETVSQLLGGLYNQRKQSEMLALHTAVIYGDEPDTNEGNDPDYYTIWPTTRQGDVLEKKMEELEKKFAEHTDEVKTFTHQTRDNVIHLRFALQELGASLYNQKTQQASWREMRDLIMPNNQYWVDKDPSNYSRPEDIYGDQAFDTSKWATPTTSQGDVLEQKVADLEKKMTRIDAIFAEKQRAVSTLPVELVPPKKITNSKWLCGND
jgi:BMFP domain-containing protein YqiC